MKPVYAFILALLFGVGLGILVGWLRISSVPWEGLPAMDSVAESDSSIPPGSGPLPKIIIDKLEYDFGTLDVEDKGSREFTVSNRGEALLKLTKGETTCRCAAGELEKTDLLPGESTKITLKWHPTDEPGPYQQSATFYTNDPRKPHFKITVSGKITAALRVRPSVLTFNRISARESSQGTVKILSYLDQPLAIGNPRLDENGLERYFDVSSTPLSDREIKEDLGVKSGFLLTVAVKPGLPQGPFKQTITLSTNNPNKKEVVVPIEGSVGEEISVVGPGWDSEQETLYLGTVTSQEGLSRRLLLVVRGPYRKEVHFDLAEPPPAPLKITLGEMTEINNGQVVQTPLLIEIPKGSHQASRLGHVRDSENQSDDAAVIKLETTHPDAHLFRIPVRFAVEK
ncbi:MAG: DUF1573 domain-containing protein [Pirellulales bacterium]|nr:DUF1573 domain-containing protein [Pirellulales bacterium]